MFFRCVMPDVDLLPFNSAVDGHIVLLVSGMAPDEVNWDAFSESSWLTAWPYGEGLSYIVM